MNPYYFLTPIFLVFPNDKRHNVYSGKRVIYEELTRTLKPLQLDDLGRCEV